MIVRTEVTGSASANVCRATVLLSQPSADARLEVVRTKLPRLPFRFAREAQVTVDGVVHDLPDARSLAHLASVLSELKNSSDETAMNCYYSQHEFEVCVENDDVTLAADLATALRLPETLVAGECYSSALEEERLNESDYYRIVVEGLDVRGYFENQAHTQTVEEFRQGESLSGVSFESVDPGVCFSLYTQVVKKDATVVDLVLGDTETACYWVKVT